jgi:hypothetical protein
MSMKVTRELTSDQSGVKIAEGKAVSVRIRFEQNGDGSAGVFRADLTEKEALELIKLIGARATKTRKPKPAGPAELELGAGDGEGGEDETGES